MIDDTIRAYYELHGSAQNMVDSEGNVYGDACGDCDFSVRHWKEASEEWVCGRCGESWPFVVHLIPVGCVQRSLRAGDFEERLSGLAEFGYALNQMLADSYWRFPAQILVGYALTSCTYAEVAEHANTYEWPTRSGRQWSEAGARQWAGFARRELRERSRPRKITLGTCASTTNDGEISSCRNPA